LCDRGARSSEQQRTLKRRYIDHKVRTRAPLGTTRHRLTLAALRLALWLAWSQKNALHHSTWHFSAVYFAIDGSMGVSLAGGDEACSTTADRRAGSDTPAGQDAPSMTGSSAHIRRADQDRRKVLSEARASPIFPHRCFCTASTSLSPLPLENTGLSIVPPIRKGNCNIPSFNVAPDSRAMLLVKKLSLVVISANPR
jgi:hypothetical protein